MTTTTTSTTPQAGMTLHDVLAKYAVPDPKIVGKLPKGGTQLDFVGHADITRILIEIDPHWRLVPIAWDNGRPAMHVVNGMVTCWFEMTLLGTARLAVGTAKENTPDCDKIVYGDALRNGAMRYGISLSLWTKQEWEDLNTHPASAPAPRQTGQSAKPAPKAEASAPVDLDTPLTEDQISAFNKACVAAEVSPITVYKQAKVKFGFAKQSDLSALRLAFKEAQANKPAASEGE
jgi:hypothetical protein